MVLAKVRRCFIKNAGYITIEASIIIPITLFVFASILFFTMLYHDVVVGRLDSQNQLLHEYFSCEKDSKTVNILFKPRAFTSVQESFLSRRISAKTEGKRKVVFSDFEMDFSYSESFTTLNKKSVLRTLDVLDNLYGIFSDEDDKGKVNEIKSKIK